MDSVLRYFEGILGLEMLVWFIVIAGLCLFVWKAAQRYAIYRHKADNLPCDRHEQGLQSLSANISDINVSLGKLETGIDGIHRIMSMMAGFSGNSQLTQSHSPISLTPKGKAISEQLGFHDMLQSNWEKIQSMVEDAGNPYDIQTGFIAGFITSPESFIDTESLDRIKRDAFLRGIPLIDYMRMLGVMARDRYFSIHGIDVGEVDKNDPCK